jgi:hypothetical protein
MNCAGTDYKVNTTSKFNYNGGKISGSWNEHLFGDWRRSGTAKTIPSMPASPATNSPAA